jgi:hypothetical protein
MDYKSYTYNKSLKLAEHFILNGHIGNFGKKYLKKHFLEIDAVYVNGYKCFKNLYKTLSSIEVIMFYTGLDGSRKYSNIELSEKEIVEFKKYLIT